MLAPMRTLGALHAVLAAPANGGAPLLRLSWAWGALLVVALFAALAILVIMRNLRRMAHPSKPATPPTVVSDAWSESARRLRPDDPGAPREPGRP